MSPIIEETPMLWSAPMVLAKLAGRKTQTRRIITERNSLVNGSPAALPFAQLDFVKAWIDPGPSPSGNRGPYLKVPSLDGEVMHRVYPRLHPGRRLWGRETWGVSDDREDIDWARVIRDAQEKMPWASVIYRADANGGHALSHLVDNRWRPSIFMPRWASRLLDVVISVRPERLQDISADDAIAEGLEEVAGLGVPEYGWPGGQQTFLDPRDCYLAGWDTINGKGSSAKNPWVWRVETRRIAPTTPPTAPRT